MNHLVLTGKEIRLEIPGSEDLLLEGVTRIEFQPEGILFHIMLGETLSIQNRLERVTLREGALVFRFEAPRKRGAADCIPQTF